MKGEIRKMAKKLKKLKLYSMMYFIFGVLNAISVLWSVINRRYSALLLVEGGGISEGNAVRFEMLSFVLAVVVVLGYLCLGAKGYAYGIGRGHGMIHISVSRYMRYALILQIVANIYGFTIGQVDYVAVVTAIAGLFCVRDYNKCSRIALAG